MRKRMPIGVEDFGKLRTDAYYFVDKTDFIREFLDTHGDVTLITRPRRFGKTLTMSMLEYFFSIEKREQSEGLFDGLAIDKAGQKYMDERGKYPVLFLTLKDVQALTWENMLARLRYALSVLFDEHRYLLDSSSLSEESKEKFRNVQGMKYELAELAPALALLVGAMRQYYGKPVILLLDEYDAPIQCAWEHGFYQECISFMRGFLGSALKTNPDLEFAVLTGVLRLAKKSIFSGLNNLKVCSVLSNTYADAMGFTQDEVAQMARDVGKETELPAIRYWYDGYHFGSREIYNPWSVINYFAEGEYRDYWVNTSANGIIRQMLKTISPEREETLRGLLNGGHLSTTVREGLIYDEIEEDEDALYSMLLTTGYLTSVRTEFDFDGYTADLVIPNREVQDVYRSEIVGRMRGGLSSTRLKKMLSALLHGEAETFSKALSFYLDYLPSYFDLGNKEAFYHGFVLGMTALMVPEFMVESNRESGYGRFDIAIFPRKEGHPGVIMEFKTAPSEEQLEETAAGALAQIADRGYAAEFAKRNVKEVWTYGIAFSGKRVVVKRGQ